MNMNVSEALINILTEYGVKFIFGIPGDSINELLEAIRKQDKIKFIHVMHEESGAFAASAQAKLTGQLSVCAGTSGPGALHLLNGLYDAKLDHAPVLAITGQIDTALMGTGYHQEVNLQAVFADVASFNQTIVNKEQIPEVAMLACQTALARRSIAHICIPVNISTQNVSHYEKQNIIIKKDPATDPGLTDLQTAADLINKSERPCILAGIGCKHAAFELLEFAQLINAPIIKALRGKDILPDSHPNVLGGIGLLGTEPSFYAMKHCDLLITIGSDFPYHQFYPDTEIPVIQIDRDIEQIGKRHPVTSSIIGDSKLVLSKLIPFIAAKVQKDFLEGCQNQMNEWKKKQDTIELSEDIPLHPQTLARYLSEIAHEDAIICCDTGSVTVWSARNFHIKGNQQFTLSGGLASMGYAMPAAIGAKLLFPGKQVIALCGDGGFGMLMGDFVTAVKYDLAIKVIVFNNSKLSMIQMEQEAGSGNPEFETDLCNPDYEAFAKSCGAEGYTVKDIHDLKEKLPLALASMKPSLVNAFINPEELTYPPHVEIKDAYNYFKSKVKELIQK